jgi:SanA protein
LKIIKYIVIPLFIIALWVYYNDYKISQRAASFIYSDINKVPTKKVALLLGCTKYLRNGRINFFYKYRIEAAEKLYKQGKVHAILVSGDNSTKGYDETTAMRDDLVKKGIPIDYIALDYAGFRTLDSVIRTEAVFDTTSYIIVTQKFHAERALYLAHKKGHDAVAYLAKDLPNTRAALRMKVRELFARTKAFLDINLLRTKPKFYGDKVKIRYRQN